LNVIVVGNDDRESCDRLLGQFLKEAVALTGDKEKTERQILHKYLLQAEVVVGGSRIGVGAVLVLAKSW